MSEINETNSFETVADSMASLYASEAQTENKVNKEGLKQKFFVYKNASDTFNTLFIITAIAAIVTAASRFLPEKISTIVGLAILGLSIADLVLNIIYITKIKAIARFSENKKLNTSMNLIISSFIGFSASFFVLLIVIIAFSVNLTVKTGMSLDSLGYYVDLPSFIVSFLLPFLGVLIIYIIAVLVFGILYIVGSYKEYTGHMMETESVSAEVVGEFKTAQKWFIAAYIIALVVSAVAGFLTSSVGIEIFRTIGILITSLINLYPLFLKRDALQHTVEELESQIVE